MFLLAEPFISAEADYRRERAQAGRDARTSRPIRRRPAAPRSHWRDALRFLVVVGR
jgi:hypothetical protein